MIIVAVVATQICRSKVTFAQQVAAVCITTTGTTTIIVQQLIEFT